MIIKVPNGDESEKGGTGCDNQWYDRHAQRPGVQHRQEIVDISQSLQVQNGVVRTKHGTLVGGKAKRTTRNLLWRITVEWINLSVKFKCVV